MSEDKKKTADPAEEVGDALASEKDGEAAAHHAPGTTVLVLILLVSFVVYYFANWKALADVWEVR